MAFTRAQLLRRGAAIAAALCLPDIPDRLLPQSPALNYAEIIRTPIWTGERVIVTAVSADTITIARVLERQMWLGAAA